jgi:hypothetical protein
MCQEDPILSKILVDIQNEPQIPFTRYEAEDAPKFLSIKDFVENVSGSQVLEADWLGRVWTYVLERESDRPENGANEWYQ